MTLFLPRPAVIGEFAFRSASNGSPIFEGYAAVFNSPSKPITDRWGVGYIEELRPRTFTRTLSQGRRHTFVVDHDDKRMLSATTSGRLRLGEDSKGLHVESDWPDTDYARNVRALHDAGERLGMSFTFRPTRTGDQWNADRSRHTVTEAILGHVTVLAADEPAYDATSASFRSLAERTESHVDDIEALFDAVREGQPLDDGQRNLLTRLATELAPITGEATEARSQDEEIDPKRTVAYWQGLLPDLSA